MPMLSGPGSIAVTLGFISLANHWIDYVAIILGILIVAIVTYVSLRLSGKIVTIRAGPSPRSARATCMDPVPVPLGRSGGAIRAQQLHEADIRHADARGELTHWRGTRKGDQIRKSDTSVIPPVHRP